MTVQTDGEDDVDTAVIVRVAVSVLGRGGLTVLDRVGLAVLGRGCLVLLKVDVPEDCEGRGCLEGDPDMMLDSVRLPGMVLDCPFDGVTLLPAGAELVPGLPALPLAEAVICWAAWLRTTVSPELELLVANEYDRLVIWPIVLVLTSHRSSCTCARSCGAQQAHKKTVSDRIVPGPV